MTERKSGDQADTVIQPASKGKKTGSESDAPSGPKQTGNLQKDDEPVIKSTVVLRDLQVAFLDERCAAIRRRTGTVVRRADIIRALIDGLMDSGLDITNVEGGEEELRTLFAEKMGGGDN